jgi:hypothetical protein
MASAMIFLLALPGFTHAQVMLPQPQESFRPDPVIPCPPPPIPPPEDCNTKKEAPLDLYIRLMADPNGSIMPGQLITYQLAAQNSGRRTADHVHIAMSFPQELEEVTNVAFTKPDAWVSLVQAGEIEMQLGALQSGEIVTATLRLRTNASARLGSTIAARARMFWEGKRKEPALSNIMELTVAPTPAYKTHVQLKASSPGKPGAQAVGLIYDGFASRELIGLWYNHPSGRVVSLGQSRADTQGKLDYNLDIATLDPGRYELVAQGRYSRVVVVMAFNVSKA